MQTGDWQALSLILLSLGGLIIALALAYIIRKNWPIPEIVRVLIWAVIWAIGGAIIGLVDNEIEVTEAVLLGAFWGALLGFVSSSGWSLWKKE
jgi:hypothetical protein